MPDNRLNLVILVANMVKEIRFCKFKRLVVWTKGNSVPERAFYGTEYACRAQKGFLVYATRFQKSTAQERASSFLAFVVFGAGNALLFLAI